MRAIEALKNSGLRVIRLDRRTIPDAIGIDFKEKRVYAIEADTSMTSIWLTKRAYGRHPPQFDEEIIITRPLSSRFKSREAYELCLKLRKEGLTERKIQAEIKKQLKEHVSSGQIHNWISGKSRPRW